MDAKSRGFRAEEHTADIALMLRGESLDQLFLAGLEGITDRLTDSARIDGIESCAVHLEGVDREDLLVRWLNEILYLALCEGFVSARAEVSVGETELSARVFGESQATSRIRHELKCATYHGLTLTRDGDQWSCRVVVDV